MDKSIERAVEKIHKLYITKEHTLQDLTEEFYKICREFNIKQGTPYYGKDGDLIGRTCSTIQWVILKDAFVRKVNDYFLLWDMLEEPPADLLS